MRTEGQWWTISGPDLMAALEGVRAGRSPRAVYLALYMNGNVHNVLKDEDEDL